MSKGFYLEFDSEKLELLDKARGDLSREEYILKVLSEHSNKSKNVNFSELKDKNPDSSESESISSQDISLLIDNFQEFANDIYSRLDRLETLMADQGGYSNSKIKSKSDEDTNNDFELEEISEDVTDSDNGKENVVFEPIESDFSDTDEDIYEEKDDEGEDEDDNEDEDVTFEIDPTTIDKPSSSNNSDNEFEYGCPYCNATISEDATMCSKCGKRFDDALQDQELDEPFEEVEPISAGYSDSGEYDPRPSHVRRRKSNFDPKFSQSKFGNMPTIDDSVTHGCSHCGNEMTFIRDYKRWYCYNCKKYGGVSGPLDTRGRARKQPIPESIMEPIPTRKKNPPPQKKRDPDWQPLKKYHRYD